jgi:hypothetical protein
MQTHLLSVWESLKLLIQETDINVVEMVKDTKRTLSQLERQSSQLKR